MKLNDKVLRWLFPALIVISFAVNYAGIFDRKMDINGDNYYYYMLARNLAEGKGYVSDIGPEPVPHTHFPPGYPAFMSLFMHIFPDSTTAMKVLNGLLLLFSLLMLYQIIARTAGRHGRFTALAACLLCTLHPELLRWSTIIMSEMLYIAISLGIIAVFLALDYDELAKKRPAQILLVVLLCALVFFTYYVRTIGISIVLATMAALATVALAKKKAAPLVACALVAVSLLAAHVSWSQHNRRAIPGYRSDYLTSFKDKDGGDGQMATLADWTGRVGVNLKHFVTYFIPLSIIYPTGSLNNPSDMPEPGWRAWAAGIVIIGLILAGMAALKGIGWLLILYTLITFAVLMLYPVKYGDTRYFIPLLPLMIAGLVSGVSAVTGRILKAFRKSGSRRVQPAVLAVMFVLLGIIYVYDQWYYRGIASDDYLEYNDNYVGAEQLIRASEMFRSSPEQVLTAVVKPEIFYFHSGRHHAVGIPRQGTPEEVIQYLYENNVDFVIVDRFFKYGNAYLRPAIDKYPRLFKLVQEYGDETSGRTGVYKFLLKQ